MASATQRARRMLSKRVIETGIEAFTKLMFFRLLDGKRDFQGLILVLGARISNLSTGGSD